MLQELSKAIANVASTAAALWYASVHCNQCGTSVIGNENVQLGQEKTQTLSPLNFQWVCDSNWSEESEVIGIRQPHGLFLI